MPIAEDVVRRFCPVFVFHPDEKFFPCSIDYLLRGGELVTGETILQNPTQQMVPLFTTHYDLSVFGPKQDVLFPSELNGEAYFALNDLVEAQNNILYVGP